MRVTKQMHHQELQPGYNMMKIASRLLMNRFGISLLNRISAGKKGKNIAGLRCEDAYIPSSGSNKMIRVRIFKPLEYEGALPGMLYIHGGGLVMGSPEDYLAIIKNYITARPCVIVAPDYRKALEAPFPAAFNDCYDTLLWMNVNIKELGIIPDKLIVAGHSAGGGIAAAVSLRARDTGDAGVAFQVPVYPMLDDRQDTASATDNNSAGWNSRSNKLGWDAYLRPLHELNADIPPYAAPARAKNYHGLPPTITFVGNLEPFCDETLEYVKNLELAGVPVAFLLFEGCYHAFEVLFPELNVSKKAWGFLLSNFSEYIDKYVYGK